jgi:Phage tail tube protein, GTA-gp10
MHNPYRGDVPLVLNGVTHILRLTLGSLAMLESAFGSNGLQELGENIKQGRLASKDVCNILAAGFCGAGTDRTAEEVGAMIPARALAEATQAAANLLAVTFGGGDASRPPPPQAS